MNKVLWDISTPNAASSFDAASLLCAEIEWMAKNAPHLNFKPTLEKAEIGQQVRDLLLQCQKKAAGGAS
ncbi:MAG: hypothetical protein ABJI96_09025 [Paracoccaceae bacterium]|uniref:hypothetical protein n=1 Tax=Roseibium sp. TaxID=1936156 RepID=UPI003299E36D